MTNSCSEQTEVLQGGVNMFPLLTASCVDMCWVSISRLLHGWQWQTVLDAHSSNNTSFTAELFSQPHTAEALESYVALWRLGITVIIDAALRVGILWENAHKNGQFWMMKWL